MLKRKFRLLKETKFDKKNTYTSPFFVLKITKNEKSFSRFGFVVSKQVDKRATTRNRIKRQVRACIENNFDKIKPGYDMLFVLKKQILDKETVEIKKIVLENLEKQKLLK
jgi:ribonuclease P protein component